VLIACGEDPASVMAQIGHTDPKFTLRVYTHTMRRGPAERARLKALVNGERVAAVSFPAEPPRLLDCGAYELPILRALAERDGQAPRPEIRTAVFKIVERSLSELDREKLPSGEPRWETRLDKARSKLMQAGCLKSDSPRGVWELAGPGYKRLGGGAPKQRRAAASRPSGAGHERKAMAI